MISILRDYVRFVLRENFEIFESNGADATIPNPKSLKTQPVRKQNQDVTAPSAMKTKPKGVSSTSEKKSAEQADKGGVKYALIDALKDSNTGDEFTALQAACYMTLGLRELGKGSSRIVFDLEGDKVLKIAINEAGMKQNSMEAVLGQDARNDQLVATVYEYDEDFGEIGKGVYWIVAEKLQPIKSGDYASLKNLSGLENWDRVVKLLGAYSGFTDEEKQQYDPAEHGSAPTNTGCLTGKKFIKAIQVFLRKNPEILADDFVKPDSWGVSKTGCLKVFDYGIDKVVFKSHYSGGRAIK